MYNQSYIPQKVRQLSETRGMLLQMLKDVDRLMFDPVSKEEEKRKIMSTLQWVERDIKQEARDNLEEFLKNER